MPDLDTMLLGFGALVSAVGFYTLFKDIVSINAARVAYVSQGQEIINPNPLVELRTILDFRRVRWRDSYRILRSALQVIRNKDSPQEDSIYQQFLERYDSLLAKYFAKPVNSQR